MSAKGSSGINFELLDMSLESIFPQCGSRHDFNIFHRLFKEVIPNFESNVEFILAEILELQQYESTATTHVYSCSDDEENKVLIGKYFNTLRGLEDYWGWVLSKLDNLYFGQRIWCAHVRSPEAVNNPGRKDEPKDWYISLPEKLSSNYAEKEERPEKEIEEMFRHYIKELYDLCLKKYPHSYVLLIPVSLNALEEYSNYKSKLGAIFLHFSVRNEIKAEELERIYSRILLFWHYYLTSELFGKRQREMEQMKEAQELLTSVLEYTNSIRNTLHDLQTPLQNLEIMLSPVCGLIYGAESIAHFFDSNRRPFRLNEDKNMPEIMPIHAWNPDLAKSSEGLEKYQTLTAAVILKVLKLTDSLSPTEPLWEQLCAQLNQSFTGPKRFLILALIEYLPQLKNKNLTPEDTCKAFNTVKAWFNDAYRSKSESQTSLPYSFLAMTLKAMNCEINFPKAEPGKDSLWVASKRPIETIDALVVLHDKLTIKEATLIRKEVDAHLLEFRTEVPHEVDEDSASNLEDSLQHKYKSQGDKGILRLGDMTNFFSKLFGSRQIQREGTVFSSEERGRRLTVAFDSDQNNMNKISVEWIGKIFK